MGRFTVSTLFRRRSSYADVPEVGSEEVDVVFTDMGFNATQFDLFDDWNDFQSEEPKLPYYEAYEDPDDLVPDMNEPASVKDKAKRRVQQISQMTQKYLKKNKSSQRKEDAKHFKFGGRLPGSGPVSSECVKERKGLLKQAMRTYSEKMKRQDPMDQINQVIDNVLEKETANTFEVRQNQRMDLEVLASPTGDLTSWSSVSVPSRKSDESASGSLDKSKTDQPESSAHQIGPGHLIVQTPKSKFQRMNTKTGSEPETNMQQKNRLRDNRLVKIGNVLASKLSKKKKEALEKQKLQEQLNEMLQKCDSGSSRTETDCSEDVLSKLISEPDNGEEGKNEKISGRGQTISVATTNVSLNSRTSEKFSRQNTLSPVEEEIQSDEASNMESLAALVLSESKGTTDGGADDVDKHASLLLEILEQGDNQELIVFDDAKSDSAQLKSREEYSSESNLSSGSLDNVMDVTKEKISLDAQDVPNSERMEDATSAAEVNIDEFIQSTPYSLKPSEAMHSPGSRFSFNFPENKSKGPISSPRLRRVGHPAEIASPENCFSDGSLSLNSIEFEKIEGIDSLDDTLISSLHTVSTASLSSARNSVSAAETNSILLQDEKAVWNGNDTMNIKQPQVSSPKKVEFDQKSEMEKMWSSLSQAVTSGARVVKDLRTDYFGFALCQSQHQDQSEMQPRKLKRQGISIQRFRQNIAECVDSHEMRESASRFSFEDEKSCASPVAEKTRDALKSTSSDSSHGSRSVKVSFLHRHLPTECIGDYSGEQSYDEGEEKKHALWMEGCKLALSTESSHSFESEKEEEDKHTDVELVQQCSNDKGLKLSITTSHVDNTSTTSDALAGAADEFVRGIINSPMANSQKSDPRMSSVNNSSTTKSKGKFSLKVLSPRRVLAAISPRSGKSGQHGPESSTSKKSISFRFGKNSPSPRKQSKKFEFGDEAESAASPSKHSWRSASSPRLAFFGMKKVTPAHTDPSNSTELDKEKSIVDNSDGQGPKTKMPLSPRFVFGGSKAYDKTEQRSRSFGNNNSNNNDSDNHAEPDISSPPSNQRTRSAPSLDARAKMIKRALSPRISLRQREGRPTPNGEPVASASSKVEEAVVCVEAHSSGLTKVSNNSEVSATTPDLDAVRGSLEKKDRHLEDKSIDDRSLNGTDSASIRGTKSAKRPETLNKSRGGLSRRTVEIMQKHKNVSLALMGLTLSASSATEESTINDSVNSYVSSDDESIGGKDLMKPSVAERSVQAVIETTRLTGYSIPLKSRFPSYSSTSSGNNAAPQIRKSLGTRRDDTFLIDASDGEEDGREELLDEDESLCYSTTE